MSGDAKIKSNAKLRSYTVSKSFSTLSVLKVHFYQLRALRVTLRHHIHILQKSHYIHI